MLLFLGLSEQSHPCQSSSVFLRDVAEYFWLVVYILVCEVQFLTWSEIAGVKMLLSHLQTLLGVSHRWLYSAFSTTRWALDLNPRTPHTEFLWKQCSHFSYTEMFIKQSWSSAIRFAADAHSYLFFIAGLISHQNLKEEVSQTYTGHKCI